MVSVMPTSPATSSRTATADRIGPDPGAPARRRPRSPVASLPSADLAIAAQAGDGEAAAELYRRAHGPARRAARAFCREADADDAVAEGLWRALRRIDQLREPAAVEGWMVRCVVRAAIDLSRTRSRQWASADVEAMCERATPAGPSAAEAALSSLDRATMAAAMAQLAPGPRQLLSLRYEAGLSVADIASALGRPAGTVRRQCVEARRVAGQRFLRCQLGPASGDCSRVSEWLCQQLGRRFPGPPRRRLEIGRASGRERV